MKKGSASKDAFHSKIKPVINLLDWLEKHNGDLQLVVRNLEEETRALRATLDISRVPSPDPAPSKTAKADCNPPRLAEFLLTMIATGRRTEAMIGDLNEIFTPSAKMSAATVPSACTGHARCARWGLWCGERSARR
jgi:hypothetical protein